MKRGVFYDLIEPLLKYRYPGISFGNLCAFTNEMYDEMMLGKFGEDFANSPFSVTDAIKMNEKVWRKKKMSDYEKDIRKKGYRIAREFDAWKRYPKEYQGCLF